MSFIKSILLIIILVLFNFDCPVFADNVVLAGKYYFGDGTGVNNYLELSPDGNFDFKWRGCLGMYDENNGAYKIEEGILILSPKRPNIQKGFQGTPTRFLPINWGD